MEKSGLDDMEVTMQVLDEKIKRLKSRESPSAKKEAVTPGTDLPNYLLPTFCPKYKAPRHAVPILSLELPPAKRGASLKGMRGTFSFEGGQPVFLAQARSHNTVAMPCRFAAETLAPLARHLQEKGYVVDLLGRGTSASFVANEMHLIFAEADAKPFPDPPFRLKDELFQILLERHLQWRPEGEAAPEALPPPLFSSLGELTFLFETSKAMYPAGIRSWAENSFHALSSSHVGRTDKAHILKALTYVLNVDWSPSAPELPDLEQAKALLDQRFYGLTPVKERILEIVAQIRSSRSLPKWGLLLNGPAGVGKTSLLHALSEILRMPEAWLEFSVLRDSEALTGSSRIYENGKPGLIMEQLLACRTSRLVMCLNEIDKSASGKDRGNPLDVLLPLLDGMGFTDTYIEAAIPTDKIFFVATCNDIHKLSKPVLDRFYRIDLPAYCEEEKRRIFDAYQFPQTLRQANIDPREVEMTPEARHSLFTQYALEPGARDLERIAERLAGRYLLLRELEGIDHIVYTEDSLRALLGPPQTLTHHCAMFPGMVFSAFTRDGAAYAYAVQAVVRPGAGKLKLLHIDGQDQRAYCRVAYECAKTIAGDALNRADVVLSVPQPLADSPVNSIGCAACVAILSALKGILLSPQALFLGGCDLYGNLYLDENTIDPYIKHLSSQFERIYGGLGLSSRVYGQQQAQPVSIIETPHMSVLCELMDIRGRSNAM